MFMEVWKNISKGKHLFPFWEVYKGKLSLKGDFASLY